MAEVIKSWNPSRGCNNLSGAFIQPSDNAKHREIKITEAVGVNGKNFPNDTLTIQESLNRLPVYQGGPTPPLKEDSVCGPKTKKAIQLFQLKHFGWKIADGRVDPIGKTIAKLNELLQYYVPSPLRTARALYLTPQVLLIVQSAQRNLVSALGALSSSQFATQFGVTNYVDSILYNVYRHFDVDKFDPSERRGLTLFIKGIFDNMFQALSAPTDPSGAGLFEYNQDPNLERVGATMYVVWGGFYSKGETTEPSNGVVVKKDRVYLCKETDTLSDEHLMYGVVHELAHFVGRVGDIDDFSYRRPDHPEMKKLPHHLKPRNASSYSNFAFEVHYGRMPIGI